MGRRMGLLAAAIMLAVATMGGVALADNVRGDGSGNRLTGTDGKDNISGAGGGDNIFGRGGQDRLFGDAGNDDVSGGDGRDRLQGGTGQDDLFGQQGNDFVNAIDLQPNDLVDCGQGDMDVAGIDAFGIFIPVDETDEVAPNCELLYVGIALGPVSLESRDGSGPNLSSIDTRAEAEQAEADGLLRQIR
jgi:Ca2+-binding RTX toxin-like protein